jgi:nitroreductase
MDSTVNIIKKRRSVRSFKQCEIDDRTIIEILEAGIFAPSAGNMQSWEFVLIKSLKQKERLSDAAYGQDFITEAPVVLVVCANQKRSASRYGKRGAELYCLQDSAAAIQNMLLAIIEKNLGACWVGAFDEKKVGEILNCPIGIRPIAIIPIGLPNEKPEMPERVQIEEVLHYEKFEGK